MCKSLQCKTYFVGTGKKDANALSLELDKFGQEETPINATYICSPKRNQIKVPMSSNIVASHSSCHWCPCGALRIHATFSFSSFHCWLILNVVSDDQTIDMFCVRMRILSYIYMLHLSPWSCNKLIKQNKLGKLVHGFIYIMKVPNCSPQKSRLYL